MTTKYNPPSVDDTGPSFTSDEIYDSEVGKKFIEALEKQRIEKCFKEIKQVLKKHKCKIYVLDIENLVIFDNNSYHKTCSIKEINK